MIVKDKMYKLIVISTYILSLCSFNCGLECLKNQNNKLSGMIEELVSLPCEDDYKFPMPDLWPKINYTTVTINKTLHTRENPRYPSVTQCMVFKYLTNTDIPTVFSCDFNQTCQQKSESTGTNGTMMIVNGKYGVLQCCNTNNCNSKQKADKLKIAEVSCMQGNNTIHDQNLKAVPCRGKMCRSLKLAWNDRPSYDCDTSDKCSIHDVANNQCKTVRDVGTICCCDGEDNCNFKPTPVLPTSPLEPMPPVLPDESLLRPGRSQLNWMFVGSLIGALILSSLVLITALILIRHCKRQRELTLQRTYSYQQLTADFATDETTGDDKLIIA